MQDFNNFCQHEKNNNQKVQKEKHEMKDMELYVCWREEDERHDGLEDCCILT